MIALSRSSRTSDMLSSSSCRPGPSLVRDLNSDLKAYEKFQFYLFFVCELMIGSSKNNKQNYPSKCFWTQEKETRVKFNCGLSTNRPSNNWGLLRKICVNSLKSTSNWQRYDPVCTGPYKFLNGQKIARIFLSFTVNACPFKNLSELV